MDNLSCKIIWNALSLAEWDQRFESCRRTSLLQSYDYGLTIATLNQQKPRWGLIEINGEKAGLIQILEVGILKNLIHAVILDMGPVWFEGYGSAAQNYAFLKQFNNEFPARFGRKRRILPSIENSDSARKLLETLAFKRHDTEPYQTNWVDLTQSAEDLRSGLKQKWRNILNKFDRSGLTVEWDDQGKELGWLLENHETDRQTKGYSGPSQKTLWALGLNFTRKQNLLIGRALLDNNPVAGIMILKHGSSATYQVGWTSDNGRKHGAHNGLLWAACEKLKNDNMTDFDLGGINDDTAHSVKKFKEGMGGKTITYIGHYA